MRLVWGGALLFVAACAKHPSDEACVGAPGARLAIVYLHGRDGRTPSQQELRNRDVLRRLAADLGARIAIARADTPCSDDHDQLCWGWSFSDAELAHAASIADKAADRCFSREQRYVVVGFSNGGYALDKLVARCKLHALLPRATRAVTVGAAMFRGPLGDAPDDLSGCGELTMISGTADAWNFDPTDHYLAELTKRGAHARAVHVPGAAHELELGPLRDALRE